MCRFERGAEGGGHAKAVSVKGPLSACKIRTLTPPHAIESFHASSFGFFGCEEARALADWPGISEIYIWGPTSKAALRWILTLPGLQELVVSHLHDHGSLRDIPLAEVLRRFSCSFLKARDIRNLASLTGLEALSMQHCTLSDQAITALCKMPALRELDLEGSDLGDEMVAKLARLPKLHHLSIGATNVTGAGLAHVYTMTELRELDIWALRIEASDLDGLADLPNLEYLSIGGCFCQTRLTAEYVMPRLAKLRALKRLWLDGIPLSQDDITQLEARYETVRVDFETC